MENAALAKFLEWPLTASAPYFGPMILAAAASAMTDALSRFDQAGHALLGAVAMGGEGAPEAIGAMIEAKVQFRASAALVRLSDDMMRELIYVVANEPR